jgi:hypothetical protein
MENRYIYKKQDITTDILFKIEQIVSILAKKEKCGFDTAYQQFVNSKIYPILQNTKSLLWAESAEFIVDEYYRHKIGAAKPR